MKTTWNNTRRMAAIILTSVASALGWLYLRSKLTGQSAACCQGPFWRGITPQPLSDFLVIALVAFIGLYLFDRSILKK